MMAEQVPTRKCYYLSPHCLDCIQPVNIQKMETGKDLVDLSLECLSLVPKNEFTFVDVPKMSSFFEKQRAFHPILSLPLEFFNYHNLALAIALWICENSYFLLLKESIWLGDE